MVFIDVCKTFPNEEFAIDLQRCQNTCEYYGRTWDCPIIYKPKGDCYCKPGFARLVEDGKCVSVTKNAQCVAKLPIKPGINNVIHAISNYEIIVSNRIMQRT